MIIVRVKDDYDTSTRICVPGELQANQMIAALTRLGYDAVAVHGAPPPIRSQQEAERAALLIHQALASVQAVDI